jgi:hypothetical protein
VTRRFSGTLTFTADGRYRIPGGLCPQTGAPFPDEVGTTRPSSHGRLLLESTNLAKLDEALDACIGRSVSSARIAHVGEDPPGHGAPARSGEAASARSRRQSDGDDRRQERFQGTKTENGFQLGAGALSRAALAAALASPTP